MPPDTLGGDLGGGLPAQFRVRPDVVILMLPDVEHEAGVDQKLQQRFAEAFIPQAPVETFDEAVLHWLAGRDIVPLDPPLGMHSDTSKKRVAFECVR